MQLGRIPHPQYMHSYTPKRTTYQDMPPANKIRFLEPKEEKKCKDLVYFCVINLPCMKLWIGHIVVYKTQVFIKEPYADSKE